MRQLELHEVYSINGYLVIKLITLAKLINYSDIYLLRLIKKILKLGIKIAFKWKRNWYIILPKTPIIYKPERKINRTTQPDETPEYPNGSAPNIFWQEVIEKSPPPISAFYLSFSLNFITRNNRLFLVGTAQDKLDSSSLSTKNLTSFVPLSLGEFKATTDYKYGFYIIYSEDRMSTFDPGTSGTLKSTQLPAAFFEVCRALDAAENNRNGANPGLTPRRNISTTVSFDTGTIAVAATLPVTTSVGTGGAISVVASDYLGSTYSTFANGSGDLSSDTLPEALLEIANLLAAAEKAVTPTENQPNNVQVQFDLETGSATISANLPFTTTAASNGDVTVHAIDYL